MKKEITCNKCDTVIANDDGVNLISMKNRMRINYKTGQTTILCHNCNFLNYFNGNKFDEESEKRNARYLLEKGGKRPTH